MSMGSIVVGRGRYAMCSFYFVLLSSLSVARKIIAHDCWNDQPSFRLKVTRQNRSDMRGKGHGPEFRRSRNWTNKRRQQRRQQRNTGRKNKEKEMKGNIK